MIQYTQGDLLQSEAEAWVNAVNTVGVMGKGIALQFKQTFPHNFERYAAACKGNALAPGQLLAVWDTHPHLGRKLIVNFPTKVHWRNPSRYEYIEQGLVALADLLTEPAVSSIAIPPLGCGYGGLAWPRVRAMLEEHLAALPSRILIYEPH